MPRILVIDDQSDVRAMISIVLRINHFDIVEAASGAAGLKEFENSRFDLVIVDIFLQGMNGFDIITVMRERIPDLPIVAISGMTTLDFLSASPELSNVICLQKPFRPNELVACDRSGVQAIPAVCYRRHKCRLADFPARASALAVNTKTPRRAGAFDVVKGLSSLTIPSD